MKISIRILGTGMGNGLLIACLFMNSVSHAQSVDRDSTKTGRSSDGHCRPGWDTQLETDTLIEKVVSFNPHASRVWISDMDSAVSRIRLISSRVKSSRSRRCLR